nr:tail fiber protein [uncultured Flavobacterium sp.]
MKHFILLAILLSSITGYCQVAGSFVVKGDIDKFYPVTFNDGGWNKDVPTMLRLGRSNVHQDVTWRGSLVAAFSFHTTNWGHGSNFIDADIKPSGGTYTSFIAGWRDATGQGTCNCIIIWLRGGSTTYQYQSNFAVNPTVYDGEQNPLPYNEVNGPAHNFKTVVDSYATTTGVFQARNAFFDGKVGIGTIAPDEKLTVKGKIHTQEVKVDMAGPLVPDYVFSNEYQLKTLQQVEAFIKQNKHLPEIPSAKEIEANGLHLAEMNMKLLQKIEELTLYLIQQQTEIEELKKNNQSLQSLAERVLQMEKKLK